MFLIIINFAVEKHLNPLTFLNMAKKVFMIPPFEAMTGNLSGDQNLQYAENNNPAYEAPNGTQYARNYRTRYVGARRGKDGLVYFQVKQTTATVLTPSTRRTMAILGVTAAIRSALQASGQLNNLKAEYEILKQAGTLPEGQNTFNKWFSANIKNMLMYKRAEWRFTLPGVGIITIHNPYDLASAEALTIKLSTWVKFASIFIIKRASSNVVLQLAIDNYPIIAEGASGITWQTLVTSGPTQVNTNYRNNLANLSQSDEPAQNPLFNEMPIYYNETLVGKSDAVIATDKYTTADPNI